MAENAPPTEDENENSTGRRSGLLGTVKVVAFLLLVIVVECAVAYMVFPTAEETAEMANQMVGDDKGLDLPEEDEEAKEDEEDPAVEVELGDFHVARFQPLSNTTWQVTFHLYGIVLVDDEAEFDDLMLATEKRLRNQMIVIIRSSEMSDLTDPGLGLIKRKILETTNRTLGKTIVKEVGFVDFSFVEQ